MASFAFVIGIDTYQQSTMPNLKTPVDDALRMTAWLVDRGGVPPANVVLLLSPAPTDAAGFAASEQSILPRLTDMGKAAGWFAGVLDSIQNEGTLDLAKKDNILDALANFPKRTAGGQRIYFYYAGHGLMSRVSFSNEDALIPLDYSEDVRKPISFSSITRFFQPLNFPEQFFFIDCCRNTPLDERALDTAPKPSPIDLSRPASDQFIFNATAPGHVALDGRGMLTDLLLDGMVGKGRSKDWDSTNHRYCVRVERLFRYILAQFASQTQSHVLPRLEDGKMVIQQPRLGGDHNPDVEVVNYPDATFPDVELALTIAPTTSQVILIGDGVELKIFPGIPNVPWHIPLRPRNYHVAAIPGPGWSPANASNTIELFDADAWTVTFEPDSPAPSVPVATPTNAPSAAPVSVAPVEPTAITRADPAWPGHILVTTDDPLGQISLEFVQTGEPIAPEQAAGFPRLGFGKLDCPHLTPGFYRASVRSPGRVGEERTLHLGEGQAFDLQLASFQPTGAQAAAPGTQSSVVSFGLGAGRSPAWQPSLGIRAIQLDHLLRAPAPRAGIEVLVAVEMATEKLATGQEVAIRLDSPARVTAYLAQVRLRLWSIDEPESDPAPAEPTHSTGLGRFSRSAAPGIYWLRAEVAPEPGAQHPTKPGANFALPILDDWSTSLRIYQNPEGGISTTLLLLGLTEIDAPATVERVRKIDLTQRFLRNGQIREATTLLDAERTSATLDPVLGCLTGVVLLRERRFADLETLGEAMIRTYPGLPDSHLILALHRLAAGNRDDEAAQLLRSALDRGLPIAASLLKALAQGADRLKIQHDRVALVQRVAVGLVGESPWTVWNGEPG